MKGEEGDQVDVFNKMQKRPNTSVHYLKVDEAVEGRTRK